MSFKILVEALKKEVPLVKSQSSGYPLSTQSLDAALKSCATLGINAKTQTTLKDLHAAGMAAGLSDQDLEGHVAAAMRTIGTKKPMTKSAGIGSDPSIEALHRARAQTVTDSSFITEVSASGAIPAVEIAQLETVLKATRGLPDAVRQPGIQAVRQQVASVAHLSPAARGIDWS